MMHLQSVKQSKWQPQWLQNESGKIGYLVAWLLGVPAWILLVIFLIRG